MNTVRLKVHENIGLGIPFSQWSKPELRYYSYHITRGGCASCHAANPSQLSIDEVQDFIIKNEKERLGSDTWTLGYSK